MKRKNLTESLLTAAKQFGFTKATIDRLESLSIPQAKSYSAEDVKRLRRKVNASQGVFAALLNVQASTIQKWEQGKIRPQRAALRLLNLIEQHGIAVLWDKKLP